MTTETSLTEKQLKLNQIYVCTTFIQDLKTALYEW